MNHPMDRGAKGLPLEDRKPWEKPAIVDVAEGQTVHGEPNTIYRFTAPPVPMGVPSITQKPLTFGDVLGPVGDLTSVEIDVAADCVAQGGSHQWPSAEAPCTVCGMTIKDAAAKETMRQLPRLIQEMSVNGYADLERPFAKVVGAADGKTYVWDGACFRDKEGNLPPEGHTLNDVKAEPLPSNDSSAPAEIYSDKYIREVFDEAAKGPQWTGNKQTQASVLKTWPRMPVGADSAAYDEAWLQPGERIAGHVFGEHSDKDRVFINNPQWCRWEHVYCAAPFVLHHGYAGFVFNGLLVRRHNGDKVLDMVDRYNRLAAIYAEMEARSSPRILDDEGRMGRDSQVLAVGADGKKRWTTQFGGSLDLLPPPADPVYSVEARDKSVLDYAKKLGVFPETSAIQPDYADTVDLLQPPTVRVLLIDLDAQENLQGFKFAMNDLEDMVRNFDTNKTAWLPDIALPNPDSPCLGKIRNLRIDGRCLIADVDRDIDFVTYDLTKRSLQFCLTHPDGSDGNNRMLCKVIIMPRIKPVELFRAGTSKNGVEYPIEELQTYVDRINAKNPGTARIEGNGVVCSFSKEEMEEQQKRSKFITLPKELAEIPPLPTGRKVWSPNKADLPVLSVRVESIMSPGQTLRIEYRNLHGEDYVKTLTADENGIFRAENETPT